MKTFTEEDFDFDDDELIKIHCPKCLDRGYQIQLGPKILMNNEPRPDDYENWLECGTCGWLWPLYEIPAQETIKDTIETSDNPHEGSKTIIESLPKRVSKTGKKIAARGSKRKKRMLHHDPDINEEMRRHGDRVNVVYDSNP